MLTQAKLQELLLYNKDTGIFTYQKTINNMAIKGQTAGFYDKSTGYLCIAINKRRYKLHRLAFLYVEGIYPEYVDHKDRDKTNLRWANLRKATRSQNSCNSGLRSDNTSGAKGVSYQSVPIPRYIASVQLEGKRISKTFTVSQYMSDQQAYIAACNWVINQRNKIHGEFACHG